MMTKQRKRKKNGGITQSALRTLILILTAVLVFASLVLPDFVKHTNIPAGVGEVAGQEILAPYSLTFESKVLTERARKEAADAIPAIYLPADPSIARRQLEQLNNTLYYITTVRRDSFATQGQKLTDIASLAAVQLPEDSATKILTLSDQAWQNISAEANRVLEQVLRDTIRENNVAQARSNLPAIIDFSLPADQSSIVIALVSPLIGPTSLFSEEQTNLSREQARAGVAPISRQIITGEVVVRRGQIIRPEDFEALNVYGLAKPINQTNQLSTAAIFVVIISVLTALYYRKHQGESFTTVKASILIAVTFLVFLILGRFLVIDRTIVPYLYPMAAFGLTMAVVFNLETAIVFSIFLSILTVQGNAREAELALFYLLPSLAGILTIGRARRISAFLGAGLLISLVGVGVVVAFRLGDTYTDMLGLASLAASALINGLASGALALLLQSLYSQLLDIPTALQLLDISRPDHPLLQFILQNAPGSYQHSLLVSNLAEEAALAIDADRILVRVGSLFHDAGKALNPQFFIENQMKDKIDSHDNLDPATSAAIIIAHVTDGVALAKKYHLPSRIIDFIREHHGTMLTRYQYSQAVSAAADPDDVDRSLFTYPGPKPQSRETAIVMLADGTEARNRAESPKNDEELHLLIRKTIETYKNDAQLEDTDLTLRDLKTIENSFFESLQRSFHPRIQYPDLRTGKTEPVVISSTAQHLITPED